MGRGSARQPPSVIRLARASRRAPGRSHSGRARRLRWPRARPARHRLDSWGSSCRATSRASRVFPTPPGPGEGHEAVVFSLKQLHDRTPVLVAPDRWRRRCRQSADRRARRLRSFQARFMGEDRLLQFPERGRRLEAKLVDQCHASGAVGLQCLGLAPAAVEGQHQLAAQALTQRMLRHERLELADQLCVPSAGQIGVDAVFEQRELKLLEPADLRLRKRLEREFRKRRAAPQLEGRPQLIGGPPAVVRARASRPWSARRSQRSRSSSPGSTWSR